MKKTATGSKSATEQAHSNAAKALIEVTNVDAPIEKFEIIADQGGPIKIKVTYLCASSTIGEISGIVAKLNQIMSVEGN